MMLIQNGQDMANLTGDYLKYIKTIEEPIMHNHLSELKHPQWGSIIGYENQIRIAVLKDEMEIWQERMKSGDIFFKTFKRFINFKSAFFSPAPISTFIFKSYNFAIFMRCIFSIIIYSDQLNL